jgi:hypothetical protein
MTNTQALDIVTAAALEFRGTRKDHEAIAQALDVISKVVPTAESQATAKAVDTNN